MDKRILAFPKRYFTACQSCGAPFAPFKSNHLICSDCWHWHKALSGIEITRQALREISRG